MSTVLLYLALVSAPEMTESIGADQDGAISWACTYERTENNVSVSLGRYLSNDGRQREISGNWEIVGSFKLRLSGLLWGRTGDPEPADWTANLGWLHQDYVSDFDSNPVIIVRAATTVREKWLQWGAAELTMPWIKVKELARNGRISARLTEESGQAHRSGFIDMRHILLAEKHLQQALASTSRDAQDFKQRCVRFNPVPIPVR